MGLGACHRTAPCADPLLRGDDEWCVSRRRRMRSIDASITVEVFSCPGRGAVCNAAPQSRDPWCNRYSVSGLPLVSRAASAAASVIVASTIIMIDTPVVPPKYPTIAVAMIGAKPPPIAADTWNPNDAPL
jgi:hypothetical protein